MEYGTLGGSMEEDMTDNKPRARIKSDAISRMAAFYTMFIPFDFIKKVANLGL